MKTTILCSISIYFFFIFIEKNFLQELSLLLFCAKSNYPSREAAKMLAKLNTSDFLLIAFLNCKAHTIYIYIYIYKHIYTYEYIYTYIYIHIYIHNAIFRLLHPQRRDSQDH